MDTKKCRICKEVKPLADFANYKRHQKIGPPYCASCHKEKKRRYHAQNQKKARFRKLSTRLGFEFTAADYEALAKKQNHRCAICLAAENTRCNNSVTFCVDHDHSTGEVRGLLCHRCNRAIGLLFDNEAIVLAAAAYLHRPKPE